MERGKRAFKVYHPDYMGDDAWWTCKDAFDHEDAAIQYGEHSDSQGDYELAGGSTYEVMVESIADKTVKKFILSAQRDVHYHARETDDTIEE